MKPQFQLLLSNSFWMTFGLGIRSVFQVAYFILIARAIGPAEYGVFASIMALVGILAPFASWGSGNILVKYTSRNPKLFGKYWGAAIATTIISSICLIVVSIILAKIILPNIFNFSLVLCLAFAELFVARFLYISGQAFQAVERLDKTAKIFILFSTVRLFCAVLFIYSPLPLSARSWAFFYLASTILSVLPTLIWVYHDFGWGEIRLDPTLTDIKEGFYYSLSLSSQGVYNDIDKTILARISGVEISGFYTAAYRIIDVTFVPITAMLNSTYARFFKQGESGIEGTKKFAITLLPWSIGYSLLAGSVIFFTSSLLPRLLGESFSQSAKILLLLIPLLPLKVAHYLAADSLTGAGFQELRSKSQLLVSGVNLLLNIWAIPILGWKGAVYVSWASDGLLAILLWWIVLRKTRNCSVNLL